MGGGGVRRLRLLAVLVAGAVMSVSCGTGPSRSPGQVGSAEPLTRIAPGFRTVAPAAEGPQLGTNQQLSTGGRSGKVVVINVWGSWCPPCRQEADDLEQASRVTRSKADFIGITTGEKDPAPALAFIRTHHITYPSIYDPNGTALLTFAGTLPLTTPPSTLIVDPQGNIAARITGATTSKTLVEIISETAAGQ
jgi:thiol-disulfide isomerase/thioredoxin